jgi:hypothetical protein
MTDEAKEERRSLRKKQELQQDRETITATLATLSTPDTHTAIRDITTLSTPRFARAVVSLVEDKTVMVIAGALKKGNNRPYDAYWLASRKCEIPQRAATGSNGQSDAAGCVASQQATPSIEGLPDACVQEGGETALTDEAPAGCETDGVP